MMHEYRREAFETEARQGFSHLRSTQMHWQSVEEAEREPPRRTGGSGTGVGLLHEESGLVIPSAVAAATPLRTSAAVSASTPSILSHTLPMIGISSAVTTIPAAGITMLASKQSISPFATTHLLPQRLHVDSTFSKLPSAPLDLTAQIQQLRRFVPLTHTFAD